MLSHGFFSKLCLVKPGGFFIVFAFVLIIPGNAILLIGGSNNNHFGTTSNFAYGQQQPYQMNSNNITDSINVQNIHGTLECPQIILFCIGL
ncbi:MAG TPA: hypothetical protein VFY64_01545 [Nitrososphaeraceae archaeon]|nr:hypothetical protein [Nitrososphaeraceae archaeon]